jgi:high affinity Mn2+ porin
MRIIRAADAWGFTFGAAVEWYQGRWTARIGAFDLTNLPNSSYLNMPLLQQTHYIAELEERHTLWDQPGKLKALYWRRPISPTSTRQRRSGFR